MKPSRVKYRNNHRQEGCCIDCPEKAKDGRIRCAYHLEYQNQKLKEARKKR